MPTEFPSVRIDLIDVPARLRSVKAHRVEVLKADIDFRGLTQPILLVRTGERFKLVDGAHRLEAVKALKHEDVFSHFMDDDADEHDQRYAEVMSNINREDLTKLERAEFLHALKTSWENMNPAARHGGDRRSENVRKVKEAEAAEDGSSFILKLEKSVSEATGFSAAHFMRATQIATKLWPATKEAARGTWLEDHQADLLKLSEQDYEVQMEICSILFADEPKAKTVGEALTLVNGGVLLSHNDKQFNTALSTWSRMPKAERATFMDHCKADFLAHARNKGWTL